MQNELDANFYYQVAKVNLMVLSSRPTKPVDALFFHSRSFRDFTGLFEIAEEMFRTGAIRFIVLSNTEGERVGSNIPRQADPGKTWTRGVLINNHHIPEKYILWPDREAHQTREKNETMLELAEQRGWTSAAILNQPHQALRAMLGQVRVMNQTGYLMEIYTASPSSTPWHEKVRGSQGLEEKERFLHIDNEFKGIHQYQQDGDLATFDELYAYLEARERGSLRLGRQLP